MRVRGPGVTLALALVVAALVGAALGHTLGDDAAPAPTSFAARPMPASDPGHPVIPAVVVRDDPYPALESGLRTRRATIGLPPFQVRLPVPRGWARSDSTAGEWRWYPEPDRTKNLYFVRVSLVGQNHQPVPAAVAGRIRALREAADVDEFALESQQDDRFAATYVAGEHRRVNLEGYLPRGDTAYVRIAVIGREADRAGLVDLFERLMSRTTV